MANQNRSGEGRFRRDHEDEDRRWQRRDEEDDGRREDRGQRTFGRDEGYGRGSRGYSDPDESRRAYGSQNRYGGDQDYQDYGSQRHAGVGHSGQSYGGGHDYDSGQDYGNQRHAGVGHNGLGGQDYGNQRYGSQPGYSGGQGYGSQRYGNQRYGAEQSYSSQRYGNQDAYGSQGDGQDHDGRYGRSGYGTPRYGSFGATESGRQARQWQEFGGNTSQNLGERQRGEHRGKGPKGYTRSDERIREDVCDCLSFDDELDASDITVTVKGGEVTLEGTVPDRHAKQRAEDLAEAVGGVRDVDNKLRKNKGMLQEVGDRLTGSQNNERGGHAGSGTKNTPPNASMSR